MRDFSFLTPKLLETVFSPLIKLLKKNAISYLLGRKHTLELKKDAGVRVLTGGILFSESFSDVLFTELP